MSDSWAVDLAREEVYTSSGDLSSTNSTPRSDGGERMEQQTTIIDDGSYADLQLKITTIIYLINKKNCKNSFLLSLRQLQVAIMETQIAC